MYRESIDNEMASSMLGEDYDDKYSYVLISDPDKFVVAAVDSNGNIAKEIELVHDYEEAPEEDDEIFKKTYKPSKSNRDAVQKIATIVVLSMLFIIAIGISCVAMVLGGVF